MVDILSVHNRIHLWPCALGQCSVTESLTLGSPWEYPGVSQEHAACSWALPVTLCVKLELGRLGPQVQSSGSEPKFCFFLCGCLHDLPHCWWSWESGCDAGGPRMEPLPWHWWSVSPRWVSSSSTLSSSCLSPKHHSGLSHRSFLSLSQAEDPYNLASPWHVCSHLLSPT